MLRRLALGLLCGWPLGIASSQESPVDNYKPRKVLPAAIRPITDPKIVSGSTAKIPGGDLVIGVEVNGEARAYRINELTGPSREIINDTLGGTAIAATW